MKQWGVETSINRSILINCFFGKCPFPVQHGHHHERSINVLSILTTFLNFEFLWEFLWSFLQWSTWDLLESIVQLMWCTPLAGTPSPHFKWRLPPCSLCVFCTLSWTCARSLSSRSHLKLRSMPLPLWLIRNFVLSPILKFAASGSMGQQSSWSSSQLCPLSLTA